MKINDLRFLESIDKHGWLLQNSNKPHFLLLPTGGNPSIKGKQERKNYTKELFLSFQLSDRIPEDNLYRRLRKAIDLSFLYKDTKELYGRTGNLSIGPVIFFKLLITGYLENITSDEGAVGSIVEDEGDGIDSLVTDLIKEFFMKISSVDFENQRISGEFNFIALDEETGKEFIVTEGPFIDVPLAVTYLN